MTEHPPQHATEPEHHGRHELPPDEPAPEIGDLHAGGAKGVARRGRSQLVFGALAVLLCVLLGVASTTYVLGRAKNSPRARHLGMDEIEAMALDIPLPLRFVPDDLHLK